MRLTGKRLLCKMKTNCFISLWKPSQVLFILKTLSINVLIRPILYDRGAKLRSLVSRPVKVFLQKVLTSDNGTMEGAVD